MSEFNEIQGAQIVSSGTTRARTLGVESLL